MPSLTIPFNLLRASRYANPGSEADILPEVYGDFALGGLRGPIPAVLIDDVNWVYCAAAHAVEVITTVYVDDVAQSSGFTSSVSNNYESQGVIATIDFTSQPTGVVTWRGRGKQSGGVLVTNPITQLEDLLLTRGGFVAADFEVSDLETARTVAILKDYQLAWVVNDERQVAEWLTEWLFNVAGAWRVTGSDRLVLLADDGNIPTPDQITVNIVASRDCGGDEEVTISGNVDHLVNALTVHYLWSWSLGQASSRIITEEDTISKNGHLGTEIRKGVTLKGHRRARDVAAWADVIFLRQAFRHRRNGAIAEFPIIGPKFLHGVPGDWITLTWPWGPRTIGESSFTQHICKVLAVRHELPGPGAKTTVEALLTGESLLTSQGF